MGFPSDSAIKSLPAMQEPQETLGQKDPPEEGMATHSNTLAWRIPWTVRGAWRAMVRRVTELDMTEAT